jgi:hypothetical protein
MFSCKKEPVVNKDIDLTDANIQIVKVEVIDNSLNPPFLSQSQYSIDYEYYDDKIVVKATIPGWVNKSKIIELKDNKNCIYVKYNWIRLTRFEPVEDERYLLYYGDVTSFGNFINNPYATCFYFEESVIKSIKDTFNAIISPLVGYVWPSQFGETNLDYSGNFITSASRLYHHENGYEHLTSGEGSRLNSIVWDGSYVKSYDIKNTLNKYFPAELLFSDLSISEDSGELILDAPSIGADFNVTLSYQTASGIPLELIRLVNQALGDLLPTAISDYILTHNSFFESNSFFWRNYGDTFYKPSSIFNNDWILTFADKRLSIIPEQNKIISGKRIQGLYLSNIIDKRPVYKPIDKATTFPYTHDPIAKTLEIAGLKIWYEVVE